MNIIIKPTESRIDITLKVLNWSPNLVSVERIAHELDLQISEFYRMDDEQFFNTLYSYVHNRKVNNKI